ncbi:MAG: helix-turn-helix transcriptional regulator [Christensenella sp.]|nr:helix-turn-helix transcriptional regulator [Christensenella sp.]
MGQPRKVTVEISQDDMMLVMRALFDQIEGLLDDVKYLPESRADRERQSQRTIELYQMFCAEYQERQPDDEWWAERYGKPKNKLSFWMGQQSINQNELAEMTGILQPNIARMLSGARKFSQMRVDTAQKIATALGKQIEELID